MSQTSTLNFRGSKEVNMGLNSIGTRILEVCKKSESVIASGPGGCKK